MMITMESVTRLMHAKEGIQVGPQQSLTTTIKTDAETQLKTLILITTEFLTRMTYAQPVLLDGFPRRQLTTMGMVAKIPLAKTWMMITMALPI